MSLPVFHYRGSSSVSGITACFMLLCFFLTACGESPEKKASHLEAVAQHYFNEGQPVQALETWNKLSRLQPDYPDVYLNIGNCYRRLAFFPEALHNYKKAFSINQDNVEALLSIARLQTLLSDIPGVKQSWSQLQAFDMTAAGWIIHGDLFILVGDYNQAVAEYQKARAMEPENGEVLARLAIAYLGMGEMDKADKSISSLYGLSELSPQAMLQAGNYWLLKGDWAKAEQATRKAIRLAPEDLSLNFQLVTLYMRAGRYQNAVKEMGKLLSAAPTSRIFKKVLVDLYLLNNQPVEAEEILSALTHNEEQDVDFHLLKGRYYLLSLKFFSAISQFQLALEKEPRLPLAHYLLALAYMANGQENLGHERLIDALTMNSGFSDAELLLADFFYKKGELEIALNHARCVLSREPESFRAHLVTANIFFSTQNYTEALREYRAAMLLQPHAIAPRYCAAQCSYQSGDVDQAMAFFKKFSGQPPYYINIVQAYVNGLICENKFQEAESYLQNAINDESDWLELYSILGKLYYQTKQEKKAGEILKQALEIDSASKLIYKQLFVLYEDNHEVMEELLNQALAHIPFFVEAQIRLARLYDHQDKPEQALSLLKKAVSAYPNSAQLSNNLAWLYLKYEPDNIDEAMRLAQNAYETLPGNAAIADTLGWIYYQKGMLNRACWLLAEACKCAPENGLVRYHLGMTYKAQNELDSARIEFEAALNLDLQVPLRQKIQQKIKELQNDVATMQQHS